MTQLEAVVQVRHGLTHNVHSLLVSLAYLPEGQPVTQWVPERYTDGVIDGSQERQLVTAPEQVRQGELQAVHTILTEVVPDGQVIRHKFPLRLLVLQEVQLV